MAKKGDTQHGAKHDIKHTSTGRMVTRRVDPEGMSVGADGDAASSDGPRGRGRPKGTGKSTGAKGPSGNSKLMNPEEIEEAIAALEECGYTVTPLEEKAVSKKQQKFMGMVHAAQKGEKPASKEVAKTSRSMSKKDAEDFASTKHEGLPEKKKSEGKKKSKDVEESGTTAGSVATSSEAANSKPEGKKKSSGSSVVGKGIYDSLNRELESMISESMNINVSMSTDPHGGPQKSVTVTATDDDAAELAMMLSRAGVNMGADTGAHACAACGQAPCGCAEVVDENAADWPTQPEYQDMKLSTDPISNDLNRNKSTGQTVYAPPNLQEPRQGVMKEDQDDECPVHGYYALPNQEDESGCTCDSGDQVDEVGLSRLSELAGLGKGMYKDDMNEQIMAEDLQADDGEHYDSFDDFIGKFDADSFDNVEEHSAGQEIRGYINGKCVMSWEFDDESMTSGYGNYDMTMLETVGIMGRTSLYKDMMRYPKGHSPEGQAHRDATAKMAKQVRAAGKEIRRGGTTNVSEPNQWGHADQAVMKYNRSELDEADMDEADSLQARTGINSVNKFARPGQTDYSEIPAGNHPRSKHKYSDEYRSSQPDRLKHSIKASLGKHAEPNLPESMASMLGRLDELAEADLAEGTDQAVKKSAAEWLRDPRLETQVNSLTVDGIRMDNPAKGLKSLDNYPRSYDTTQASNPMYFKEFLAAVAKQIPDAPVSAAMSAVRPQPAMAEGAGQPEKKSAAEWLRDPRLETQVTSLQATGLALNNPAKGFKSFDDYRGPDMSQASNPMYFRDFLNAFSRVPGAMVTASMSAVAPQPAMAESVESHAGRLFRELQQFKG